MKVCFQTILILCCSLFARAQESVNSTGGEAFGTGGTVSFSVGQVFYTTNTGSSGLVEQGVQHAYVISSVGLAEATTLNPELYPNPTSNKLNLLVSASEVDQHYFVLLDTQGRLILKDKIILGQTQIDVENITSSTYFLEIFNQNDQKLHQFKIIKN